MAMFGGRLPSMNTLVPLRRLSLGQPAQKAGRVIVVDAHDRPVSGASVSIQWKGNAQGAPLTQGPEGQTNSSGIFEFSWPEPWTAVAVVTVRKGDYGFSSYSHAENMGEQGLYVKIPVILGQPIITPVEIGALVVGLGLTIGGMYMKSKPAEVVGEVLFGAAAFTVIFKIACP